MFHGFIARHIAGFIGCFTACLFSYFTCRLTTSKTLKVEFVYRHRFETRKEAIAELGEYLQIFYNC
ncbi:hypothetical protein CH330_00925 [candidate division WOR-3 bacterium JGI_Cruoil_03_51_56]|uniref:Integrase catalytic domain-containing protein n=1 Tax=candidate division WOR-3 bacterium JGI_Cruoil_03_51_56 TaxID=1973747 RepID=A0A235BXL1_UNCW3|nr:MAG: hypothetical protein CH330_00925 [candidate division WOR-3 bacterium JGI_Cruoil_03_51_56]